MVAVNSGLKSISTYLRVKLETYYAYLKRIMPGLHVIVCPRQLCQDSIVNRPYVYGKLRRKDTVTAMTSNICVLEVCCYTYDVVRKYSDQFLKNIRDVDHWYECQCREHPNLHVMQQCNDR